MKKRPFFFFFSVLCFEFPLPISTTSIEPWILNGLALALHELPSIHGLLSSLFVCSWATSASGTHSLSSSYGPGSRVAGRQAPRSSRQASPIPSPLHLAHLAPNLGTERDKHPHSSTHPHIHSHTAQAAAAAAASQPAVSTPTFLWRLDPSPEAAAPASSPQTGRRLERKDSRASATFQGPKDKTTIHSLTVQFDPPPLQVHQCIGTHSTTPLARGRGSELVQLLLSCHTSQTALHAVLYQLRFFDTSLARRLTCTWTGRTKGSQGGSGRAPGGRPSFAPVDEAFDSCLSLIPRRPSPALCPWIEAGCRCCSGRDHAAIEIPALVSLRRPNSTPYWKWKFMTDRVS